MRIIVPITGEVTADGGGNPNKPIRPLNLTELLPAEFTDFGFKTINYDFDAGMVELELSFSKNESESDEGFTTRQEASQNAILKLLREHTADELYELAKQPKLDKSKMVDKLEKK